MTEITSTKRPADIFSEVEWLLFSPFMIHKFLSMNTELLDIVNYIQCLNISDKRQLYTIYRELIPVDKRYYPYLKKQAMKENNVLSDILKDFFEISSAEMKEALPLLSKETIEIILEQYGYDKKEVKKLMKGI